MIRRFVVLASPFALAVAGLAACGDDSDGSTLSASTLEDAVRTAIEDGGFGDEAITDVSCPDGEPREGGHSLECTATVDALDVSVGIDQDDGPQVATAVYETGSVEDRVETDYFGNTGTAVSASCSDDAAIVVALGSTFDCTVEESDGRTQTISVTAHTTGAYQFETPPFAGG